MIFETLSTWKGEVAVASGMVAVAQAVLGPDSLIPIGVVAGGISAVATGAAVGAWTVRGRLDKIDRMFQEHGDRLGRIEKMLDRRQFPRKEV